MPGANRGELLCDRKPISPAVPIAETPSAKLAKSRMKPLLPVRPVPAKDAQGGAAGDHRGRPLLGDQWQACGRVGFNFSTKTKREP